MKWPAGIFGPISLALLMGAELANAAINLDGSQAAAPALVEEDTPAPISDPDTYYPDQHDCPLPCVDYANTHSWIPYISVDRLRRCGDPMLLQFSVTQPLDNPNSNILIRSCTLSSGSVAPLRAGQSPVENPKKSDDLIQPSLNTALACTSSGQETSDKLSVMTTTACGADGDQVAGLLEGMKKFFDTKDNCDENFLFAYHKNTVASVYIGARLGKTTATSALMSLAEHMRAQDVASNHTVAQLCSSGRQPERVFGISIDIAGDLAGVQKTALEWSKGKCAGNGDFGLAEDLAGARVVEIARSNTSVPTNGNSVASQFLRRSGRSFNLFGKRATCRYIQVEAGDGCWSLSQRCGISTTDFEKFNPKPNLCQGLQPGNYVCCSAGDPYEEPKPDPPKPNPDGTCATHLISNGDTCDSLATQYGITVANIENWNKGKTWAWTKCERMLVGYNMCVSSGLAPMPPPQAGTQCGPLVPGSVRPTNPDISLADINPCPLKACCSNWGFCGVFPAHCEVHAPPDGGPGSKEDGYSSTCVSNCGTDIKQNSGPPDIYSRIGYYEAWNQGRPCLWMKAKNANIEDSYTHIHWAFASIDPITWKPVIVDGQDQWADFKALKNVKRIVSFGGWAYSTEPATYNIIRQAIIDNRNTFATNLAQFVEDEGLDGVDIDWEYPGVSRSPN